MLTTALSLILLGQGGLVKTDIKVGTGPAAKKGDVCTMLYKGTLTTGKVFDETTKDKPPFAFTLGKGEVIKGWDQGIAGMKVGGKRKLVVPASLGYGSQDMGDIKPNSTLNFTVELLRIDSPSVKPKVTTVMVKKGTGVGVKLGDKVTLHYTGSFINGHKFDSSRDRNAPVDFEIKTGGLIVGFRDAIIGMKRGERKKVTIPYQLAYGPDGRPPTIPPVSTLVFDIEVFKINGK